MLNNQTNWAPKEPNNLNNAEYCLCYSFVGDVLMAKDCDCKQQNYVICEVKYYLSWNLYRGKKNNWYLKIKCDNDL
jgi:hypothetical protein